MGLLSKSTLKLLDNIYQVRSYQAIPKTICTNFELHTNLCEVRAYHVVAPKVYQLCAAYRAAPAWIPEDPSTDPLSSLNVPLSSLSLQTGSSHWKWCFEELHAGQSCAKVTGSF